MVDSVEIRTDMRKNSEAFFYKVKVMEFNIRNSTKAFLLENEGSVFCLETTDVDVTRVLLAQVLITLKKEAVLKENLNEIIFTDFSSFTTKSKYLQQNEDRQKNFPDLLVCELSEEEQLLDKQSHILKSWMSIIKLNCKKIVFIVGDPKHLEKIMRDIEMANIFKLKLDKLWKENNELISKNEAICGVKNNEANFDEPNLMNDKTTSARALDEDADVGVVELHSEATVDNADLVNLLQTLGVEELDAVNEYGNTQLHLAARNGKMQIIESLLAHGAKKDIQNNFGSTALHLAARYGHSEIVNILLEHGFNVNATNNNQYTPLYYACSNHNDANLIEILLKFGAGIESKTKSGLTAVHLASIEGHSAVVNALLKHGANINAQNNNGDSPLHLATSGNKSEVVLILLEHSADFDIKNKQQKNALELARFCNFTNIIQIFENHVVTTK